MTELAHDSTEGRRALEDRIDVLNGHVRELVEAGDRLRRDLEGLINTLDADRGCSPWRRKVLANAAASRNIAVAHWERAKGINSHLRRVGPA